MSRVMEDEGKPPYLYWMRVMQMFAKIQQNLWHPRGDVVRKGLDTTCQTQYSGVTVDQGCKEKDSSKWKARSVG